MTIIFGNRKNLYAFLDKFLLYYYHLEGQVLCQKELP